MMNDLPQKSDESARSDYFKVAISAFLRGGNEIFAFFWCYAE